MDDRFGERRKTLRIQLIEVETLRLPIFMEAKAEIEPRLALEPGNMCEGFRGFGRQGTAG